MGKAGAFGTTGFRDLHRRLSGLSNGLQAGDVRSVLHEGAEVIADEARALAPVDTGFLKAHIVVADQPPSVLSSQISAGEISVYIGPTSEAFYGFYDEFGTSKQAAHPFMRPAVDTKGEQALGVVAAGLRGLVTEAGR